MKEIHTAIDIHASAEHVWNLLTDLERFSEWNPFIWRASGTIRSGEGLIIEIRPPNSKAMTLRPTVLKAEPNRELRWLSQFFLPKLLDREHIFTIESQGARRVRFVQREIYTGLLVPLFWGRINNKIRRGFKAMNMVLKWQAENAAVASRSKRTSARLQLACG
ncbi:MAG: SRPBCC domain-containing protein [Acidobacteria bacterium]|nr:SRPBCC domain-containing protein [Acidobacteriota bacterium]